MFFKNSAAVFAKLAMVMLALTIVGCEPAKPKTNADAGHSHDGDHAHAETLADAVKELEEICSKVKAAFDKNDPDAADQPIHDVGHVLEEIKELTKTAKLDDAGKTAVGDAVNSLLDAFGAIHEGMHEGKSSKTYADVATAIETALKTLNEKAKS